MVDLSDLAAERRPKVRHFSKPDTPHAVQADSAAVKAQDQLARGLRTD